MATRTANDTLVLGLLGLLWQVEHTLRSRSKLMEGRLGVTGPQRLVLRVVSRHRGLTPGELAGLVHLHPSTLTGILQRLVDRGLLARTVDTRDHRRARLRVLPAASRIVRRTKDTVESRVALALGGLPLESVERAQVVLRALADSLMPHPVHRAPRTRR